MSMKCIRRTLSVLAALALLMTLCASALASESKTLAVGPAETYKNVQSAIDFINAQTDKNGWTINVKAGTYPRFTVPLGMENLSIIGESESAVTVNVLNSSDRSGMDNGGINIFGKNVLLKNLTVKAGTDKQQWYDAAVSTSHLDAGGANISLTMESCTVKGPGVGTGASYGIFWSCSEINIKNCRISDFSNGIEFMNDNFNVPKGKTFYLTGNTISNVSFAIHGYFEGGNGGGTLLIANNTVTGSDIRRAKVIVQDNVKDSLVVDIRDNVLTNALVGTVNLQDKGDLVSDVLSANTFGKNCFYVEAIEPGTINFYSTFHAPAGQYGHWQLTGLEDYEVDWGKNPEGTMDYIQDAVNKANAEHSTTLSLTGIDEDNLIKTFTWFKDGLYWVTEDAPAPTPVPSADVPQTGDRTPLLGAVIGLLLSCAVAALLIRRKHA